MGTRRDPADDALEEVELAEELETGLETERLIGGTSDRPDTEEVTLKYNIPRNPSFAKLQTARVKAFSANFTGAAGSSSRPNSSSLVVVA
eukprot:1193762-Prorocentrum_minimum.AAC.4